MANPPQYSIFLVVLYIPDSAAANTAQQQKVVMTLHSLMKECNNMLTKALCPFSLRVFVRIKEYYLSATRNNMECETPNSFHYHTVSENRGPSNQRSF